MASGGTLTRVRRNLKRDFPDHSSREDDRNKGNQTAKQGRVGSDGPIGYGSEAAEAEESLPRDSDVRDTDPHPGTDTDPVSTNSDLLAQSNEYRLSRLFYRDRLKQTIEDGVEPLSLILTKDGYFSEEEYAKVTELAEKGNQAESSAFFVNLVMVKDSRTRKAMWETFAKMRTDLPKLEKILKELQELGPDPHVHISNRQDLPTQLKDLQQKHKETLREQTETLRVKTILVREKEKGFQLVDGYAELTLVSAVRDRRLVEDELRARGGDHEESRENHLSGELEKIQLDQLFQNSSSQSEIKSGRSAVVAGGAGIGKTTMVQKIVYDWATGKIYQQFQFVFRFNFKNINSINSRTNLRKLILDQYPYFGNLLREISKKPERLLFIFDGLDEFKHKIDFTDSRGDTESQYHCLDPESWCEVPDIVRSLIQGKLLPGCSVLVTTRPTALHLLEKADISVWAEILGFDGEARKQYFIKYFKNRTVAAAVFTHVKENEILYTMSCNPSFCCILALTLGPFFTQRARDPQRLPRTVTQLYFCYIYNIFKYHSCEIEDARDVLLRVGQMAFRGASQRKIGFTDEDLIKYDLEPSQFLSGFLTELLERKHSVRSVVYTFPHHTIQEFVAALTQYLILDPGDILNFLTATQNTTDGRLEAFLCFVAGLSSPKAAQVLEEFLGPFVQQTTCQVIDWVKAEVERQSRNRWREAGKNLLNTMYYLFESENSELAQTTLESVESLSFSGMTLTPTDCAVLSHVIGHCETVKLLDLSSCQIQGGGFQSLGPRLHKFQELRLNCVSVADSGVEDLVSTLSPNQSLTELNLRENKLGDSGVKLVSAALRNPECKIQRLGLWDVGLTDSGVEDLVSTLSAIRSLTELDLGSNDLGDSGVKLLSAALSSPECKITKLGLWYVGLTDSGVKDLASVLSTNQSVMELNLGLNSLTDRSVPALRPLMLSLTSLKLIKLDGNRFSRTGKKELWPLDSPRPELSVIL